MERKRLKFALPAAQRRASQHPAERVRFQHLFLRQFPKSNPQTLLIWVEIPFGFKGV
jgi:hypothetical protein